MLPYCRWGSATSAESDPRVRMRGSCRSQRREGPVRCTLFAPLRKPAVSDILGDALRTTSTIYNTRSGIGCSMVVSYGTLRCYTETVEYGGGCWSNRQLHLLKKKMKYEI